MCQRLGCAHKACAIALSLFVAERERTSEELQRRRQLEDELRDPKNFLECAGLLAT